MLFSTLSFSVEKNYCHGDLVDFSIVSEPDNCCADDSDNGEVLTEQSCCSNEVQWVQGQDELDQTRDELRKLPQKRIILSIHLDPSYFHWVNSKYKVPHLPNPPPRTSENIRLLKGVFLI